MAISRYVRLSSKHRAQGSGARLFAPLGERAPRCALLRNSRKTECGAIKFLPDLVVRAAPFALLRNSPAQRSLARRSAKSCSPSLRAGPALCRLLRNSRTTDSLAAAEPASSSFPLVSRPAACALLSNCPQNGARGQLTSVHRGGPRALCGLTPQAWPPTVSLV